MGNDNFDFYQPAPRYLEIITGIVCALFGIVLTGVGVIASMVSIFGTPEEGESFSVGVLLVSFLFLFLGVLLTVFAWRLLLKKRRKADGGLLSPFALRIGAVIFFAAAVLSLFSPSDVLAGAGFCLFASGACLVLAKHREKKLSRQ
jgi:tellurite resistance protein TehA-like permease